MWLKPKQGVLSALYFLLTYFSLQQATAEIYKWVDAAGKVHYSDRKLDQTAQAQDVDIGVMPPARATDSLSARRYAGAEPSKWIMRSALDWTELQKTHPNDKLVYLYFGGDCVSPLGMDLAEFNHRYNDVLQNFEQNSALLGRLLGSNGYRNMSALAALPKRDSHKQLALMLKQTVSEIRVNACSPTLSSSGQAANLDNVSLSAFSRHNLWLSIRWQLVDADTGEPLLTQVTQGSASSVAGRREALINSLTAAYEEALNNLLAQPEFALAATPQATAEVTSEATETRRADAEPPTTQNLTSALGGFNQTSLRKAKLANALVMVTPLKMQVTQYYLERGDWPASFVDLQLNPTAMREPGLIEQVALRLGGVIQLDLDETEFGAGQYLQLIPREAMGGTQMAWDCRTNLEAQYWVGPCTGK